MGAILATKVKKNGNKVSSLPIRSVIAWPQQAGECFFYSGRDSKSHSELRGCIP